MRLHARWEAATPSATTLPHTVFRVRPSNELLPMNLGDRGAIRRRAITATVSVLSSDIGAREVTTIAEALGWDPSLGMVARVNNSPGPGNVVTVEVESDELTEVFTGFGAKGVAAEAVGAAVAIDVEQYLEAGVPVGRHLADQLLLWLALAGSGSFRTLEPTSHTRTHCHVIREFLDVDIVCEQKTANAWELGVVRA